MSQKRRPSLAERADPHALYEASVQGPEGDIEFFLRMFRRHFKRVPVVLREDFCGTAYLAASWLAGGRRRRAIGVDLDAETLDWGRRKHIESMPPAMRRRIQLVQADVRDITRPKADLICALNFSYCTLKTRQNLGSYFHTVYRALESEGLFICELYGGTEAVVPIEEEREVDDFTYVWEQESYDAITHDTLCHIHFEFSDGSKRERAFTYDWRLWTIPEVRELLADAGFRRTEVYWEETDDDGDGTGEFRRTESEENQEGFIVYIVGVK